MKVSAGLSLAFCAVLAVSGAHAEPIDAPPPFPQFSFKRVKPPSGTETKRITIQIDPEAQAAPSQDVETDTASAEDTTDPAPQLPHEWFWASVSPALSAGNPGRLDVALGVLAASAAEKGLAAPRLQSMQAIARDHGTDILVATIGTRVSPALVLSVISVESSGRSDAVSEDGALGLMQLIPATAERFGVDPDKDEDNIKGGVAYLDWLLNKFDGDPMLALAAYNAGENAVLGNEGVPPYPETRAYVPKVLNAWRVARGLCATPPELISDGCVFVLDKAG